jgi:hypothetical protein
VELVRGPRGQAAVAWMASEHPLRMEWRVGERTFKGAALAHAYAKAIVSLD